jgi:hypothetical protein
MNSMTLHSLFLLLARSTVRFLSLGETALIFPALTRAKESAPRPGETPFSYSQSTVTKPQPMQGGNKPKAQSYYCLSAQSAIISHDETLDFPLGTIIVKSTRLKSHFQNLAMTWREPQSKRLFQE